MKEHSVAARLVSSDANALLTISVEKEKKLQIERIYKPDIECQIRAIALILRIKIRMPPQKK